MSLTPIPKPQAEEKAAAQRKKRKESAEVRCVGGNNSGADLERHGMDGPASHGE